MGERDDYRLERPTFGGNDTPASSLQKRVARRAPTTAGDGYRQKAVERRRPADSCERRAPADGDRGFMQPGGTSFLSVTVGFFSARAVSTGWRWQLFSSRAGIGRACVAGGRSHLDERWTCMHGEQPTLLLASRSDGRASTAYCSPGGGGGGGAPRVTARCQEGPCPLLAWRRRAGCSPCMHVHYWPRKGSRLPAMHARPLLAEKEELTAHHPVLSCPLEKNPAARWRGRSDDASSCSLLNAAARSLELLLFHWLEVQLVAAHSTCLLLAASAAARVGFFGQAA
ncbi:hypothetical protein Dimus_010253 [Dionaea muscipula]